MIYVDNKHPMLYEFILDHPPRQEMPTLFGTPAGQFSPTRNPPPVIKRGGNYADQWYTPAGIQRERGWL